MDVVDVQAQLPRVGRLYITQLAPPYATNRLEVDDGHSSFCGRPFNDGMIDWDRMCEFMFHTQK